MQTCALLHSGRQGPEPEGTLEWQTVANCVVPKAKAVPLNQCKRKLSPKALVLTFGNPASAGAGDIIICTVSVSLTQHVHLLLD